jgi:polyisoprenoid-binding protein YceI
MNKNAIVVISLGAAAFLTALFYIYFQKADTKNQQNIDTATQQDANDPMLQQIEQNAETVLRSGLNENEIIYTIKEGEVTYGADKQFLGKDGENVIGTSTEVQGTGYWNKDTSEIELSAAVNLAALSSGSEKRDTDIQPLFTTKMATFRLEPTKVDIKMGENFEQDITGTLIINGVSKTVTFKTKGMVTETNFNAEGTSMIKMSDFNVTDPNMAGMFTVADELPISFKVAGESVAPTPVTE